MSRVLVTGGSGFIGSHVVDKLMAAGHRPRVLDVRPWPYRSDVESVVGDILDLEAIRAAMRGCRSVVHLAAAADVGEVASEPVSGEELNVRGTINVLQAAREGDVGRVVYASTIWVYADVEAEPVDEETPLAPPAHLYTATKLAGELYCRAYGSLYGLETTILRFGIPYGPRARPAAVLPIFVGKALAGEPLTLAGGGTQSRRFVYVEDLAEGVVCSLTSRAANRTFNLVGEEDVTVRDIAERVREVVGDLEVVHVEGRAADFRGAEVSGLRAAQELGWRPRTPFAEGVRRYVAWHREQAEQVPPPIAPTPSSRAARLRAQFSVRLAVIVLVGLLAGVLAAAVTRTDVLTDPASLVGTLALLAVPTALVARVDWYRDRRDAAIVFGAMLAGALLLLTSSWVGELAEVAFRHPMWTLVLLVCSTFALDSVRRLRAARA